MFHYTSEKALYSILDSKKLWLVSSLCMNDVVDRFYANLFSTVALLKSNDKDAILLREKLSTEEILKINSDTLNIPFYSLSFCKKNNNEYLWKNYSDDNKGVCIEIDEQYYKEFESKIIVNYYQPIDENENPNGEIIQVKEVKYDCPVDLFLKVLKETKKCCLCENDNNAKKEQFSNWLLLTLTILSGTIKSYSYSDECEVRWLFKNKYIDEYFSKNSLFIFYHTRIEKVLKILGADTIIADNKKERIELNLESIFNSKLIKTIIIGDKFSGCLKTLKQKLNKAGMDNTIIKDKKGNVL